MRFRGMMRSGKADGLEAWLGDAVGSGIYCMRVFEGCRRIWPLFGTRWRRNGRAAKCRTVGNPATASQARSAR
jgi:hypothetical protein